MRLVLIKTRLSSNDLEIWISKSRYSHVKVWKLWFWDGIYSGKAPQSQLLSKAGDKKDGEIKSGEGNRKRLKISIPYFDNSDLIKSYSRTLIGRCMNPEQKAVKSLLVILPKIWHLEEKVVGVDLGMGRFQFHFEKEEDILTVLEMQPYHFDYWMLALGQWQPRILLHDADHCPLNPKRLEKKKENRDEIVERSEDRSRSYKGVVIHGNEGHHQKNKEHRGYQGKGKGKMYEEQDAKWTRVPERGNKRSLTYRRNNIFEKEGSRNRNARWERSRTQSQEDRERTNSELRRVRSPLRNVREEPQEEGVITTLVSDRRSSQQEERSMTVPLAGESLEEDSRALVEDGMELEEDQTLGDGKELDCEVEDEFENLTDREEKDKDQEEPREMLEEGKQGDLLRGMELVAGDAEKKDGARKQMFLAAAGGAVKKKFAQVLLSPRKHTTAKHHARKGGNSKQVEEKGPSNPKPTSKP
ncbi:hypothetical protein Bca101_010282 [Brassica carinata]